MDKPTIPDMATRQKALNDARERYDDAQRRAAAARSDETDALNALNQAQKAFDDAYVTIRKASPAGSDWARISTGLGA